MAKYKDILGNIRECEDKTITISLERYNTLIIKEAIADADFKNVHILALDCVKEDDNYQPYEYTENVTSVIYREEQSGFLAGYGAVKDGYTKLGFVGGMAVPAVVRYGAGYVQGAAKAAEELKVSSPVAINYYYAGEFNATAEATSNAKAWYDNGTEVIFACGISIFLFANALKSSIDKVLKSIFSSESIFSAVLVLLTLSSLIFSSNSNGETL